MLHPTSFSVNHQSWLSAMLSNRVKRNIRLLVAILSGFAIINRAIRITEGDLDWWQPVSLILITAFCIKFYLCYSRQVKRGNFFGRVKDSDKSIEAMSRRTSGTFIFYLTLISLFNSYTIDHEECKEEICSLEDRITELGNELENANSKIEEYESKLDQIQSKASDSYQAIQYFIWSYELQEALDAFDNIQNEASFRRE